MANIGWVNEMRMWYENGSSKSDPDCCDTEILNDDGKSIYCEQVMGDVTLGAMIFTEFMSKLNLPIIMIMILIVM